MRRGVAILAAGLLALPVIESFLGATMARRLLVQVPALILLGAAAGWPAGQGRRRARTDDLAWLAFAVGALLFWMIPRSLDLATRNVAAGVALEASLFGAGVALARSLPFLPVAVVMALGIHAAAMTLALGLVYLRYPGLICTAYTLEQQRVVGADLLRAGPVAWILLWGWAVRSTGRLGRARHVDRGSRLAGAGIGSSP